MPYLSHSSSLDPQVVLDGHHECRDSAAISTEFCHQWGVLRIAIPHLNIMRPTSSMTFDIHVYER